MLITPSFKKSLIVEQFQGNYLKSHVTVYCLGLYVKSSMSVKGSLGYCQSQDEQTMVFRNMEVVLLVSVSYFDFPLNYVRPQQQICRFLQTTLFFILIFPIK